MKNIRLRAPSRRVMAGGACALLAALPLWEWTEGVEHHASDAGPDYRFGHALSLDGDTLLVGADFHDGWGSARGAAYVFVDVGTGWTEKAILTASDAADWDVFGYSVAVSGDTALIGAPGDDDGGLDSGSAYVFVRSGTSWVPQAKLTASDAGAGDSFAYAVALSGDTALIGARHKATGFDSSGAAYVFQRTGTIWSEQAKIVPPEPSYRGYFGYGVALEGDTALIGAPGDIDGVTNKGSAWVFVRTGTAWSLQAKLTASDGDEKDGFGSSVALSGERAVIGAVDSDLGGVEHAGAAYVFERSGTVWMQHAKLVAEGTKTSPENLGRSVALSGETILVGASWGDGWAEHSGVAYVYVLSNGSWVQEDRIGSETPHPYDRFGSAVALAGDLAFIGIPSDDGAAIDCGAFVEFRRSAFGSATFRNAGANPVSYATTDPVLGTTMHATVDLGGTTGHSLAWLVGFAGPLSLPLAGGQFLLVDVLDPQGELLGQAFTGGPVASFDLTVPNLVGLIGFELSTQALHWGGVSPYALSNAQDLFLGFSH